jgi:hypothetical protein
MLIIARIVRLPARQDDEPSYRGEFGWERLRHEGFTGTVCDGGRGSAQDRPAVIFTPDEPAWVFLSSSLAGGRRGRSGGCSWCRYESGAQPHPPHSMSGAYLERSQVVEAIIDLALGDGYGLAAGKPMLGFLTRPAPKGELRGSRR